MGTYWDLHKDLLLRHEKELGSAMTGSFADYLGYRIHRDDWRQGHVTFEDSNFPDIGYYLYDEYPDSPTIGDLVVYADYEVELSAVTGQTDYTSNLSLKGLSCPAVYLNKDYPMYPVPVETASNWIITDGTQVIYFSADYEGNKVGTFLGLNYPIYVGYGDDADEGCEIHGILSYSWIVKFKQNTTGPVTIGPVPFKILRVDKTLPGTYYAGSYTYLDTSGDVKLTYDYRPLYQPERARFQYSMEFDGTTERLQSEPAFQTLDLINRWTIAAWVKPLGNTGNEQQVFCFGNDSNPNRIHLFRDTLDASYPWVIDITDPSANQKTYYFGEDLDLDEWYLIGAKYVSGTLTVYVNGVAVTPTDTTQDDAVTMTDTGRYAAVGGKNHISASDGFEGRIFWAAAWSGNIGDVTMLELYNNPQMLLTEATTPEGTYSTTLVSQLEHWYRPAKTLSPNLGKDYGVSPFDLDDEKDVGDTNRVMDYPRL
jgi:hypothetical protein